MTILGELRRSPAATSVLSDLAAARSGRLEAQLPGREATMATVYVITAGSGDTYRIERVYLDRDQAYGFAEDYNGIAPNEPVEVEEWETGAPPGVYDGPYWRAQWWARVPVSKRRGELRHTRDGERFDDFEIRQEWWTGDALPDAKVVRRELAGIPRVEVAGRSKEKVEELFWDTITQVRADLAGSTTEIVSTLLGNR
jgi:hypothetical protein